MPEPYSNDLRTRAVEKAPAGESRRSVAKELRAAAASVIKWARRYSDTGSAGPSRMGTRRTPKLAGCRAWILERINACPAITLAGLQDWLGGRGVAASLASIWRFLRVCGPARKKPAPVADERARARLGPQGTKGLRSGPLRPLGRAFALKICRSRWPAFRADIRRSWRRSPSAP